MGIITEEEVEVGRIIREEKEEENRKWPIWLNPLLRTSFFGQCKIHPDAHKSECNMYCLDCMNGALCCVCLSSHKDHHSIQVLLFTLLLIHLLFNCFTGRNLLISIDKGMIVMYDPDCSFSKVYVIDRNCYGLFGRW